VSSAHVEEQLLRFKLSKINKKNINLKIYIYTYLNRYGAK